MAWGSPREPVKHEAASVCGGFSREDGCGVRMNENILLDLGTPLHDRDGGGATGGHLLLPPFQSVLSVAIAMDLDSRSQPSDVDSHQECRWG